MAGETVITVIGNLTANPELRFTASGQAVASFTIASTPRTFDRETGTWKDGEALFMRCSVWREMAENVAESLTKGMRVIASGRLQQRSYETQQGERRTTVEMTVDEVGPSLRYAKAQVNRNPRQGDFGGQGAGNSGGNMGTQGVQGYAMTPNQNANQAYAMNAGQGGYAGQGGAMPGNTAQQNPGSDGTYGVFDQSSGMNNSGWGAPPEGGSSFDDEEPPF